MSHAANALRPPKSPSLLIAPKEYNATFIDQLNGILRLYFNRIDTTFQALVGTDDTGGGRFLRFAYGAVSDFTNQTLSGANTPQAVTFDTEDLTNGVSLPSSSKLTITTSPGIYNIHWSGELKNTSAGTEDARYWVKLNGVNVAGTSNRISVPLKHGAVDGHIVGSCSYLISLEKDDYVEFWWEADSTAISLETQASGGGYPSTPSTSATVTFVSALME
tara:strand:- start:2407 stop:3063 length:657 start_codon:yes stop_codon:yes gene_type:complete